MSRVISTIHGPVTLDRPDQDRNSVPSKPKRRSKGKKMRKAPSNSTTTTPTHPKPSPNSSIPPRRSQPSMGHRLGVPKISRKTGKIIRPSRNRLANIHERRLASLPNS